jgi:hypothetical protein
MSTTTAESQAIWAAYQPTLDVTRDPREGLNLSKPADKIAYNRRLAEMVFVNYQENRQRGVNYRWQSYGLVADDACMLLGVVEPQGEPHPFGQPGAPPSGPMPLNGQDLAYYAAFPDFGPEKGSMVCFPFEAGCFWRMVYGGTDNDGEYFSCWELNFILVNDEGKITHFECWNDFQGFDILTRKVFGVPGSEVKGLPAYIQLFESLREKSEAQVRTSRA